VWRERKEPGMRIDLEVRVSERTGLAYLRVPGNCMWDLVEYLAMNRTQVYYGYSREGFTVTFLKLGKDSVKALLGGWTDAWMKGTDYDGNGEQARGPFSLAG
jgi:hypothetical protein